ncbi:MAG: hypothetical protein ACTHJ3_17940 [Pararhizobium sp.]
MNHRNASTFETLLQHLESASPDAGVQEKAFRSPIRSNPWFIPETAGPDLGKPASLPDAWAAVTPDAAPALPPATTDPAEIARELDLGACPDLAALARRRRRFAASNHPDRVAAALRPMATQRMTIANLLIDAEIRRRKRTARA